MPIEDSFFEIMINNWNYKAFCDQTTDDEEYIIVRELGKINKNEHCHILFKIIQKPDTFRRKLSAAFPNKTYSMKKVRCLEKYLKYMSKDTNETNQWLHKGLMEFKDFEYLKLWQADGDKITIKTRNANTSRILNEIDDYFRTNPVSNWSATTGWRTFVLDTIIKINGLAPTKVYLNQIITTIYLKYKWDSDQKVIFFRNSEESKLYYNVDRYITDTYDGPKELDSSSECS